MVSTDVNDNAAIKRFTYDWLIRFAELYPFKLTEDYYAADSPKECNKPGYMPKNPKGQYNPYRTKYAAISSLFTAVIAKHIPYIYYFMYFDGTIIDGKIYEFMRVDQFVHRKELQLPSHKEIKILIGEWNMFTNLTPGMITWFNENHVFFYGESLNIALNHDTVENIITPDELKYLLKIGRFDKEVRIEATLTEPMAFSEIWPLIAHCKVIILRTTNLVHDEDIINNFRNHRVFPTTFICFCVDISDQALLKFFDFILSLPVIPNDVYLYSMQEKPISLGEAIIDKIKAAIPDASDKFISKPTEEFNAINFYGYPEDIGCFFFQTINLLTDKRCFFMRNTLLTKCLIYLLFTFCIIKVICWPQQQNLQNLYFITLQLDYVFLIKQVTMHTV